MTDAHTHRPDHEELVALYALGMLEGDELDELEGHLAAGCQTCRRELAQRRGEVVLLADLIDPETPSAGVREAVLARMGEVDREASPATGLSNAGSERVLDFEADRPVAAGRRRGAGWLLALAAVLLVALVAWSLSAQRSLRDEVERLTVRNQSLLGQLEQRSAELDGLQTRLASTRSALRVVADAPVAVLAGLEAAPGARGRVYDDPRSDSVLVVVDELPRAPEGRVYQVWGIVAGKPVSAGTFDTSAGGDGYLVATAPANGPVDVWAITEEPAGGVPQPTGAMVLKG